MTEKRLSYPSPIIIVGIGEMAGVFARGFLRAGYPVYPITRNMDMATVSQAIATPELVLIAVAEADVQQVLNELPENWRNTPVLLQNELLPTDWLQHGLDTATVISVWFEKKPGHDFKVIVPSPAFGQHAQTLEKALGALSIPVQILDSSDALLFELVRKNLYILTSNIAGLRVGGTVSQLWAEHQALARAVAEDIYQIQTQLCGQSLDFEALLQAMVLAFEGDPEHKCMGRSAPVRLARALQYADKFDLAVPTLRAIQAENVPQ